MHATKLILIAVALLTITGTMGGEVCAFHGGGVGPCEACHSIHSASPSAASSLLKASDPSSTCLHCHERVGDIGPTKFHVSTSASDMPPGFPPKQLTPGGDFGWLKKTYSWIPSASQTQEYSYGDRHGHNITANDYYYYADITNASAPQGTYPGASLTCISCHDPHGGYRRDSAGAVSATGQAVIGPGSFASSPEPLPGQAVGVYRLLGGRNYQPKYLSGNYAFVNDPPAAVAPDNYNRSESATQTRVAYGTGMSEWCRNCHITMHTTLRAGATTIQETHPIGSSGRLGSTIAGNYSMYIKTGLLTGSAASSFLSLVPFEEGTADYATLKSHAKSDDSYLLGPDAVSSQVMCLTCHRAHASAWDKATRWNARSDYLVNNGFFSQESQQYQPYGQGRTEAEAQQAYYGMQAARFALNQDTLCHKCHPGSLP